MTSVDKDLGWPPYESPCPDFWTDEGEGVCYDTDKTIDLSCVEFTGTGTAGTHALATTFEHPYLIENANATDPAWSDANEEYSFPSGSGYNIKHVDDGTSATIDGSVTKDSEFYITDPTYAYFDPDKKDKVEMKRRKQWAKRCGLTWSGVTNTNHK